MATEYKYGDLTGKVIGCAMEVHRHLRFGFQEVIYQRALAHELGLQGISYAREVTMQIFYKGTLMGTRRVDFIIEDILSVELKAVGDLEGVHFVQAMNYLEIYQLEVGLLINFGAKSLQWKRLHNKRP